MTSEASQTNNNLTFVRLILASSVIICHTYEAVRGKDILDPISFFIGTKISSIAVDGFFFLSGYLVYASLMRRQNALGFFAARLARIWPALITSVLLTVVVGGLFTIEPALAYLHGDTKRFVISNLLFLGGNYNLTGIYCQDAACNVNGSLWTIPWEIRCYALLAALLVLGLAKKERMSIIVLPATLAFVLAWHLQPFAISADSGIGFHLARIDRLWTMFALGITAYLYQSRIQLSWLTLAALLGLTILQNRLHLHAHMESLFAGYLVLCLGFLTVQGQAFSSNWHDYSYGIYIYAFPVMTLIQQSLHFANPWTLAVANLFATLPLAAASWHLVEKPCLKLAAQAIAKWQSPKPWPQASVG